MSSSSAPRGSDLRSHASRAPADAKLTSIPFTQDGLIEAATSRSVPIPIDEVWPQVVSTIQGLSESEVSTALQRGDFIKPPGPRSTGFHLSPHCRAVAIQGGWWYRGVTCVRSNPGGTLITFTIVNVAKGWTKWLAHWFHAPAHRRALQATSPRSVEAHRRQ